LQGSNSISVPPTADVPTPAIEDADDSAPTPIATETKRPGEAVNLPLFTRVSAGSIIFGALLVVGLSVGLFFMFGGKRWLRRALAGYDRGRYRKINYEDSEA
jgi:hypothetical protein